MGLTNYFDALISKVEASTEITNMGKDANGFFRPTKTVVLRQLHILRDLHGKPRAKPMIKAAWEAVVNELPSEWLVLSPTEKEELKNILAD